MKQIHIGVKNVKSRKTRDYITFSYIKKKWSSLYVRVTLFIKYRKYN